MVSYRYTVNRTEKLHQQLYEINALYPRHVTELQGKIQLLEKQNQELQVHRSTPPERLDSHHYNACHC